jgi:hypothetical protein
MGGVSTGGLATTTWLISITHYDFLLSGGDILLQHVQHITQIYYCSSEQGTPRGAERTTWLGRGSTVAIGRGFCWLKTKSATSPPRGAIN